MATTGTSGGIFGMKRKTQKFTASGTFTPTQAMLDAGGVVDLDIRGGGGAYAANSQQGGCGGSSKHIDSYQLLSLTPLTVTIGTGAVAGGAASTATSFGTLTVPGAGNAGGGGGAGSGNAGRAGQCAFNGVNSGFSGAVFITPNVDGTDYGQGGGSGSANGRPGVVIASWWEKS